MDVTSSLAESRVATDRTTRRAAFRDVAEGGWPLIYAASLGPWHIRAGSVGTGLISAPERPRSSFLPGSGHLKHSLARSYVSN